MIDRILEKARRKVDEAEVFHVETRENEVSFENGILKSTERTSLQGVSLRVIDNGRMGFAAATDPGRIDDMIDKARAGARHGKQAGFSFPAASDFKEVKTFDPAVESYDPADAIREGRYVIDALGGCCNEGLTDVSIVSSVTTTTIANTAGLDVSYRSTDFSYSVVVNIIKDDSIIWIADGDQFGTLTVKSDDYIRRIADLAVKAQTKAPRVSGRLPVIFTAQEMPNLLYALEMGVDGKHLAKGDSPLIGREGEPVLGSVSITDDPHVPYGPGSRPFDDEGVPSRRTDMFEKGVFRSFLFDLDTAAEAGRNSTASAARGMLASPRISPSNMVVSGGESQLEEMIGSCPEGIIVHGVLGGGQSNLMAGDFSLNVMLGFYIRHGEIGGRLIDTMVSGNVYEAFPAVSAMTGERKQVGSLYVPDIQFSDISVSGSS